VLYTFCPQGLYHCADGAAPIAPLVKGTDGNFYGSAASYGANDGDFGTVFQIMPSGTLTTLHSFGGTDGAGPLGALIQATNGEFYGTTSEGLQAIVGLMAAGRSSAFPWVWGRLCKQSRPPAWWEPRSTSWEPI
jgi:uncharacterized repeat protein (TIGR03803 family)